jgi:hypothetical protein
LIENKAATLWFSSVIVGMHPIIWSELGPILRHAYGNVERASEHPGAKKAASVRDIDRN